MTLLVRLSPLSGFSVSGSICLHDNFRSDLLKGGENRLPTDECKRVDLMDGLARKLSATKLRLKKFPSIRNPKLVRAPPSQPRNGPFGMRETGLIPFHNSVCLFRWAETLDSVAVPSLWNV